MCQNVSDSGESTDKTQEWDRKHDSGVKRNIILDAAEQVFSHKDYHNAALDEIALFYEAGEAGRRGVKAGDGGYNGPGTSEKACGPRPKYAEPGEIPQPPGAGCVSRSDGYLL